ncbi:cytochrome c oxidase subunit 2 [Leptothrix sp. C29]|uniref:Nitrous-oxide reductase n=2 Tax=Sphaerotilus uruguayifluvii TaxID=2735897 RepID=A0ABX2G2U7_9BURK|nr:cytochrome c oxidase subunit 2 [Leptothrix sp. C29]
MSRTSSRRRWLRLALASAGSAGGLLALGGSMRSALAQPAAAAGPVREVEVTARRFEYLPNEIVLKAGEPVVLLVRSLDFVHGMNFPVLGLRADLVPGRITRVEIPAQRPGVIDFVCDNFCGDGHEEMHGRLVVRA